MRNDIYEWIEDHYDESPHRECYVFKPQELSFRFHIEPEEDQVVGNYVIITPTKCWEELGELFDDHFEIEGHEDKFWAAEESIFEVTDEAKQRAFYIEIGMKENENLP